jgi:uncharacterized protein
LSWGDPLVAGLPAFDVATQTPELAEQRFGFNRDFTAFFPLGVRGQKEYPRAPSTTTGACCG